MPGIFGTTQTVSSRVNRPPSDSASRRASFLGHFQPELNGFPDVGQRLTVSPPLTMAARQCGTGNGKAFRRFHHDDVILHNVPVIGLALMGEWLDNYTHH